MTNEKPRRGRPRVHNPDFDVRTTPLYKLFVENLPEPAVSGGNLDVKAFAGCIGVHSYAIRRWMEDMNKISVRVASKILAFSDSNGGTLTKEKILPYTNSL